MTKTPLTPEEYDVASGSPDSQKWEAIVAPNMVVGRRWAQELLKMGISIRQNDVYTLTRPEKFQGCRFTKVYMTPYCGSTSGIRELLERAQALYTLQRTVAQNKPGRFEGFYIIEAAGRIYGPSQTL